MKNIGKEIQEDIIENYIRGNKNILNTHALEEEYLRSIIKLLDYSRIRKEHIDVINIFAKKY